MADEAALLEATLQAFNVTDPDDVDDECPPEDDTEEEIMEELSGVANGLKTVLSQTKFNADYLLTGQLAAAKVVTRLLRQQEYEANVIEDPLPGIHMTDLDGFLRDAEARVRDWFAQVEDDGAYLSLRTITEKAGNVRAVIDACLE